MKLSDRDLKLIVIFLIAAIIACPIFFVLKPFSQKTADIQKETEDLSKRYSFLKNLANNIEFYEENIDLLNAEREKLISKFAEGVRRENTIMFLANTEQMLTEDVDEFGIPAIRFNMEAVSFEDTEPIPISEGYVDEEGNYVEGLAAVTCISTVSYVANYSSFKGLLEYIQNDSQRAEKGRIVITAMTGQQSTKSGLVEGVFVLRQYAVIGGGRTLAPAKIPSFERGNENIFGEPAVDTTKVIVVTEESEED